ncbi:MAG: type II toxin-antitoxin system HipA family toxin [Actinomycetia bacterium]|nr:type II toxin-antitoxin system HipA family toxin [Actinomycetes bacterium]
MTALDVWIGGRRAGQLSGGDGSVVFAYDASYQDAADAPALSVSMPKTRTRHPPDVVEPWIDNLLPDNDSLRERWAARFGERRATPLNLLGHMGLDCAGAVQIVSEGVELGATGTAVEVTDAQIQEALTVLRQDDSAWIFGDHGGRYSLGGAQGKFALARTATGWALPAGRQASTHVFKVGIRRYADSVLAEYVTMRAAETLGLRVTHTELIRFGGEVALVSRRFDRLRDGATVRRIHQEDLCQALGTSRHRKYEAEGGPGAKAVGALIGSAVDPRDRAAARELFAQSVIFNWLVAGTDAHAKNFAVAHLGPRVLLAPLYDLTSAALLDSPKEVFHKGKLAMRVGGEYHVGAIGGKHLALAAADIGVRADWMCDTAQRYVAALPSAVAQALAGIVDLSPALRDRFAAGMSERVTAARRAL